MKNSKKGFVVLLLVAVIALLVIVSGVYIYKNKKTEAPTTQTPSQSSQTSTTNWKTFSDTSFIFNYPVILSLKQDGETITLSHSIAYKHSNPCDFKGDASPLDRLSDFYVSLTVVSKNLKDLVQSTTYPGWDYVSANPFQLGSLNGYKIMEGVEGCGKDIYYFTISPVKTLVIDRALITEFSPIIGDYQTYLNLPGIIPPNQAEEFFTKILSSIKIR